MFCQNHFLVETNETCKEFSYISLWTGAGANILRGVAGAGVLSGSDKLKELYVKARLGSN